MAKIIIIGGGIIGLCTGLMLLRAGKQVTIIDKSCGGMGASYGNAGHIAPEQTEPLASWNAIKSFPKRWFLAGGALSLPPNAIDKWLPFSMRLIAASMPKRFERGQQAIKMLTLDAMNEWKALLSEISRPDLLDDSGHYVVWESENSAKSSFASWKSKDIGSAAINELTPQELANIQGLTNIKLYGGAKFSGTGHIKSNIEMLNSIIEYLKDNGAEFIPQNAKSINADTVLLENGETLKGDKIIITAGFWSKYLMESVGHKVPIIAERGYHIQSEWGDATGKWQKNMPPVVFEDRSMIVTPFNQGLRTASFVEFSAPENAPDTRKWDRLRKNSKDIGIYHNESANEWMGNRPTLPDYIPAIGKSNRVDNLYYAFGHQHLGLTLAAVTAKIIRGMICDNDTPHEIFDIKRFE